MKFHTFEITDTAFCQVVLSVCVNHQPLSRRSLGEELDMGML